jgi:hypothetical protein
MDHHGNGDDENIDGENNDHLTWAPATPANPYFNSFVHAQKSPVFWRGFVVV